MRKIEIVPTPDALAAAAVEKIIDAASTAIAARGRFTLALTGGSTPEKTYTLLADPVNTDRIDWSRTFIFSEDERDVPVDDARSNFGLARRTLIDRVDIPASNVFPMVTSPGDPGASAAAYEALLKSQFPGEPIPVFDLIHLGMGDDGHCASLFPGHESLKVVDRLVVSSAPGVLPPPVDRVTFTLPIINAAREVMFLVTGEKKADTLAAVLADDADVDKLPSSGVNPIDGVVTWLVDKAAAAKLPGAVDVQ